MPNASPGQNLTLISKRLLAVFKDNTFSSWESFAQLTKELGHILREQGVPVDRIQFPLTKFAGFLHPTIASALFTWTSEHDEIAQETYTHDALHTATNEDFLQERLKDTPYYDLIFANKNVVHFPLDKNVDKYEVLPNLKATGYTDYFAFKVVLASDRLQNISFATKHSAGFDKKQFLKLFASLKPVLTLCLLTAYQISLAVELANAYIGPISAKRVLAGQIIRGTSSHLEAGILFCDLRGFTKLNEKLGAEQTVRIMNQVFEEIGIVLREYHAEILKFIGDAMLILLPAEQVTNSKELKKSMLRVCDESTRRVAQLANKLELPLQVGFGGNIGEVYYGNIGTGMRLDFTIMGPAVNKASRLEALCSRYNASYIVSTEAYVEDSELESLGDVDLKGISEAQPIYGVRV